MTAAPEIAIQASPMHICILYAVLGHLRSLPRPAKVPVVTIRQRRPLGFARRFVMPRNEPIPPALLPPDFAVALMSIRLHAADADDRACEVGVGVRPVSPRRLVGRPRPLVIGGGTMFEMTPR